MISFHQHVGQLPEDIVVVLHFWQERLPAPEALIGTDEVLLI